MTINECNSVMTVNLTTPVFLIPEIFACPRTESKYYFYRLVHVTIPTFRFTFLMVFPKAAIHSLVKNLVKFLIPYEIRVNCVARDFVDTEWQDHKPAEVRANISKKISLKRFAGNLGKSPPVYLFIINTQYLNGEIIEIDGECSYE